MLIKVTRSAAIAALLRGETLWSLTTGEGWELDLSIYRSARSVRRFLSSLQQSQYHWEGNMHVWALRR